MSVIWEINIVVNLRLYFELNLLVKMQILGNML